MAHWLSLVGIAKRCLMPRATTQCGQHLQVGGFRQEYYGTIGTGSLRTAGVFAADIVFPSGCGVDGKCLVENVPQAVDPLAVHKLRISATISVLRGSILDVANCDRLIVQHRSLGRLIRRGNALAVNSAIVTGTTPLDQPCAANAVWTDVDVQDSSGRVPPFLDCRTGYPSRAIHRAVALR